jgi:hypothetical protein
MLDFTTEYYKTGPFLIYTILFFICAVFDSMSHALKESIVRSQPLDQDLFSFRVSISQFIVGMLIFPAIVAISKEYENYEYSRLQPY